MPDRRQLLRSRVYYGGLLAFNAGNSTLACVVRNFSKLGAKIEFEGAAMLPDEVDFAVERTGLSCLARLIWREPNAAGLVFSVSRDGSGVIPLEWARKLRASEQKNSQLRSRIEQLRTEH